MMYAWWCVFLVSVLATCNADIAIQCPNVRLKFPFELSQFLGIWYEISRFSRLTPTPTTIAQNLTERPLLSSCVRLTFTLRDDGKLRVERSGLDVKEQLVTQVGEAAPDQAEHAKLFFKYPGEIEEILGVVDVDYEEHALLYGCHLSSTGHVSQDAWILSREPTLASATTDILKGVLASRRVDIQQFIPTKQDEECKHLNPYNATIITAFEDLGV